MTDITKRTINEYGQETILEVDDRLILQRGDDFISADVQDLLTGAVVSDTYANILVLRNNDLLSIGATYYVTDRFVYLNAIDVDLFALQGHFFARNGDHQAAGVYTGVTVANGFAVNATGVQLGVWNAALLPNAGDMTIYNNLHWMNLTGAVGTAPDGDAVNWEAVPNTNLLTTGAGIVAADESGYIYEMDDCDFYFTDGVVTKRQDRRRNIVVSDQNAANINLQAFQWGNDAVTNCYVNTQNPFLIWNEVVVIPIRSKLITDGFATMFQDQGGGMFKEYHVDGSSASPGGSGATLGANGASIIWTLNAINEFLYFGVDIHEWDGLSDIVVIVAVGLTGAEANNDLIRASIQADYFAEHEDYTTPKTQTRSVDHDIGAFSAIGDVHELIFIIDHDLGGNLVEEGDIMNFRFWLDDVTTAPIVASVDFITAKIEYLKVGEDMYDGTFPVEG